MMKNNADIKAILAQNGYSPTLAQVEHLAAWSRGVTKIVEAAAAGEAAFLDPMECSAVAGGIARLLYPPERNKP